ncbi:alpha-L-arabinofuranosidase C-terminal domain-containing protein [Kribbella sp. NPDC003505]|uniref:alpha-L-arabinofuranosidase C-terminal domain-containing protein n=1 Tax=Kribbella sp. NPDC003505 TaxID=3154448 RepID=UPI0033A05F07
MKDATFRLRGTANGAIRPEIYGQFLSRRRWVADEALHNPGHPESDASGLRRPVVDAIAELGAPVVRWPGGCTGTSYDWERGIGPRRERTVDWHFGYDVGNGFGTAEFVAYCRRIGAEPQINLTTGTGSLRESLAWIEYCNGTGDSVWANLRRSHGYDEPFGVRYWQIGNEEWGSWELGQVGPHENAVRCREWAKAIKRLDPELKVLAIGCFEPAKAVDWNLALLREAWEHIDYLTLHTYWQFDPTTNDGDYARVLSGPYRTESAIVAIQGLVDLVAREKPGTAKPELAFTEWNCADATRFEMSPKWRPGETRYRTVDALAVASFLNVMQRQAESVTLANFAQTVNVVGALVVTDEDVVRETVYWPLWMQRHHSGSIALAGDVACGTVPGETLERAPIDLPALDVSASADRGGSTVWLSVVNRDRDNPVRLSVDLGRTLATDVVRVEQLHTADPLAMNTLSDPDRVAPRSEESKLDEGQVLELPPSSYTIIELTTAAPVVPS